MTDLDQARKRQIIKVAKAEDRLNVTAKPVYIPTSEQNDVIKHMEANYQQSKTPTTVGDTLRDMSVNLDLGANSGVNNFTTGLYGSAKFVYDNFGRAVNTPVVGAMALFNGEKVSDAIKESWNYEYTPSTKNFIEGLEKTIGLVPTHKYEEQMKPYLSDRYREDEEELDKATSTGSELQDFMNTVSYYYNNPRHLGMNAVKEVADMSASAALGLGASKAVGLGGKASASLVGEGFSSYGNASSELMERGVNPDSLNGVLTAGNIAGVNMLTQRVLNTRYSPENMLDNLLKSRAAKSISMNEARSSLLKIGVGAGAEAVEGVITGGHERIAINNATGKPLTEGVGRAIGEEVAIGASLGGASTTLGLANEKVSGLGKDNKPDLGKLFNEAQDISNQKLQKITDVANKYNIPFNSKFTNPDTKNPIQVAIMGDYSKKDTGKGTGDHYDLRLARDANGKRGDINPYLDRFMVNGKALSSYKQTGKYMEQRTGYKHEGVDYGFAGSFSKNPEARNLYINPKYKVTNITAFDNNKHGGGWVTQVTFSDGIKVNILHQNKEGALAIVDGFKQRKPVTASQYIKHKNLNLGATPYDDLMKEIYTKYGYTEQEQRILKAQLAQESGFNPKAVSHAGAKGIAQFLDGTAKQYGVDVNDVASSIDGQARFMRDLLKKSNGSWEMALAFYNAGAGSTDAKTRFNKVKGIKETNQYYNNILANAGVNPDSIGIDATSDVDDALSELNNLLSQLEQEEANAKTEEDKAKLQEQLNTLRTQLAEIANLDQQEQEIKEQGKQIFIDTFNDGVTELEIDENPFLNDEEKAEYKKQLGILRGDETNIDASEPSTIKPKTYDEIEQEYVVNTPVDDSTNQGHTELTNNEPIFTQRFSLSSTTPEEIDSNPNLTSNQKRAIHKMMDVQRQIADTRDVQDVTNDIIVGSVGNTIRESNRGLQDYITGFENAINANNIKAASDLLTDLQYLRDTRISKNNAINQALQLVEDNNIKDINDAPIIAQDADTKEWFITEYTGLREGYPEFDGSNALTIFKPNKLTERLDKEAKLVDDFTNAWADYLSDYNIEGTQAPTLDTSMATVTSKTANRATRSYDEAEATFKGGEFTQERVKSELPPLTETSKNPIDVKAGKIQLVQDINQVPEDGVFLGRGRYTDESGKSRPSSMYDMEQGRINVGDAGWLASPYNPPRQGYKPNPFTLADSKPSTHAEAYGSYFKRMFMRDDGFAKAVLELEPSKLYRTKYSTTEAQFIDSFLQNVPKESVEDARAWVTDKVYGIENGKPTFRASKIESTKEAKTTKPEASNKTEPNDTVEDFPVDTSEELTNLKLDEATLASVKEQLTGKSVKSQSNATESKDASTVENSPVDVSDELTELKLDKSTLASLKKQLTGKSAETKSNDTKTEDASTEASTKETSTDSNEVSSKSNKPSLTGFKKQSTTVNSVFNNTPEQVEQEKSKHWQSQNHLILGFKQEADKPLVNILDLASNLENDLTAGIEELLPNIKATEAQIKQVKHFLDFNKAFVNSLKNSYHKEAIAADGRDYSFRDFKGYLQKEDGSFDENILTALSLSAYSHFIVNNKDINSYKDIGKLLNYPDDITIPSELLFKYKYVGDRYNNIVNSIGRTAYDLLGLKTNKDVSELYKGRMIASLGNWVVSSMVNEGLMYESTISNAELKKDSYDLDDTNDDETTDDHSIITLLSFTRPDGEGKKTLLDDIAEINKGTQGFLGKLFGGDVGLRSPTLEPTESVKRDIRGTTAKVSDTQAKLQKHMQQEPIVINSDSFNSLHKLVEKFPEQAKTMIGAYISKDTLDSMHESKRVGAEAKAEGTNRELERLIGFTSGLDKDGEGNYQEFFDSNYVTKNNRGQYNSNEVNMQTMKIHRAMVDYKNFKQVIEANALNNITGTETDFVVDGELTDLGHLFSAIAENAEGTEDVIENMLKHLTYRRGFTVDKVRAEDFLPAFFEHLETDEAVQTAVTSTQKLLEGKELSQSDMDNIQSVVDAWKMQALSFRALVEYAKFKQAQKDNTDLITSFGLGADGVNNGSAISYTLMGLMVNKQNPDLMNQIGVFTEESGFSTFHETRLKGLKDYYEGLGTIMEQELSTYEPDRKLVVNLFYRINPSIQGRKGAKEVLMPAGYGAGTKRLLEVAFESLIRDVTDSYESLHNRHKNLETNKGSMSEAEYNKEMGAIVDDYNNLQNDLRAALNDRGFNLPHPSEMLESDAFLSKKQQEKLKEAYNDVIGTLIINSFNKYSKSFNEARKANIRFHEASANIYLTLHKTQLNKALEAKKEKIKESLNTTHKELVQNRLDNANAKRTKNKQPLTYEDMLETMAKDQLEFEGLTKQEYKEQVEKPLLKVFPTLNTAFNYAESRHKRKLSDIRILKSKTTTVDVSDSYQMKTKGADGKVKYKKASVLTQEWVSAGVASNSAQVQGVDARIAFEAAAMNGNVSLNVHDNVISGRHNYVPMVRVLNKKFYETTRDYHANLASVNAFIDTLEGLVNIKDDIDEEVFNKTVIDSLINFLGHTRKEREQYLHETSGDFETIMSDAAPQVMHEVGIAIQKDIQKLRHYEKASVVHQYAGYGGEYKLTAEDKAKEKEELEKLEKVQETVKEKITKLLARVSKPNNSNLEKLAPSNFINHTGGAYGADTAWDLVGREFGVTNHKHYRAEGAEKLSKGLKDKGIKAEVLPKELIDEYRNKVNSALNRDYKDDYVGNLQARNYAQVINSDAVYAIARLNKNHKGVMGGTNTAVQLAIKLGKPVYVWDIDTSRWHTYKIKRFVESDTPRLTKNFAGIGTRDIESFKVPNKETNKWIPNPKYLGDTVRDAALNAIRDVYNNSILETKENEISDESTDTMTGITDSHGTNFSFPTRILNKITPLKDAIPKLRKLDSGIYKDTDMDRVWDGVFTLAEKLELNAAIAPVYNDSKFEATLASKFRMTGMFAERVNRYIVLELAKPYNMDYRAKETVAHEILHLLTPFIAPDNLKKINYIRNEVRKAVPNIPKDSALEYTLHGGNSEGKWDEMFTMGLTYPDVRQQLESITMSDGRNALDALIDVFDDQVARITSSKDNYFKRDTYDISTNKRLESRKTQGNQAKNGRDEESREGKSEEVQRISVRDYVGRADTRINSLKPQTKESEKEYTLNALKRFVDKLREDSPEFNLFDYLESVFDKNKDIKVVFTDKLPNTSVEGMYDNKTNTAYFRESLFKDTTTSRDKKIRLINHELLHALTETGLRQGKANNSKAYQDLTKMYEQIKAKANGRFAKELSDIHEFIAYGLTDEKFRKFIADNLDVKDISIKGRFKDTLTKFLAAVHSILGFNTSNNFDKFTKTVHKLIVPYEPILETGKAEQRYSQSDVTSDMSTVEVIQSLDSSMINSEHNQRLNDLTQRIIGIFGMNSNQDTLVDNSKILQSDALVHGFRMSDKEIAVYNSLHAVFTAMETHKANHSYQSLVKLYSDAKKQLSYKDFLTTDRPTSEDILEAKSKYDYLFNSKEHLNDRIAVFASLGLANEEMVNILQKPRQLKERELNTWFDKLMAILDKVIKALTEKAFFKGGKDFQSQLNVLSDKLLKVDADVRANKRALHERAWQGVGFLTKPLNMAIKSAMRQGIKPATKLKGSDNGILDTIGRTAETFAKLHENGSEEKMQKLIENILSIQKGAYNELGELVNEVSGFVGSGSKRTIERLLRVTQSLGRARDMWKTSVMNNILKEFSNNGKDLTKEQKSAVTRTLLRTDVSSLLDGNNTDYVIRLIKDSKFRKQEIGELHSLILSQGFSKSRANGIIMSAMDLAAYLSHEEVPDNLYKNAEGIARFYGVESDTNILKAIDKLATIQALSYIDNKDIDTVNDMLEKYPDALINLLELHKAYATISKEQEFAQNKYSYQKGYLPQKTNSLRSLQFAKSMQEVEKLKNEGWELITKDPQGMKKDSADHTDPKYLMFHKNINYREYNSGALEMKDTHAKGAIIYTHRDHKDINRYIRDKDKKMVDRNTNVDPKDYNPFENTGNMVMAYDPEGAIINVHYEMRGSTRDKYLERDNNFDVLMGMYAYGINTTPVIREQQKNVAKALYEDFKSSYKREPHLFMVLDPKSKDPKIQEMYRMMPYSFRTQAREMFGQGNPIMVRKSLFLTVFGYRQLSLADLFDKQFNDLGFLGKGFVSGSYLFLGKKAKGRITAAEYFTNKLTKIGKDFIVIRNPKVLKGNIIANSLMLMLHGINPVTVVKEYLRVWKQGRDYVVLEKEMYDLMVEINKAKGKRRQDIQNEINDIQARLVKHPMHVYFKEGIMSSIVDEVQVDGTDSYGSIWEEKFDEYKNKLIPKEMQQGIDFFMMDKGSPLHNAMSSATQFSDFSAKVILIEHLKKSGMSEKMAIAEAQETFINYDIPASPMMDYASRMGFFMFINFLKRFQKPLVKSLGRIPASTILQHMITENFTNEAGILDPFILNRIGNNPFDMGMLSAVDAFDDIGTIRLVDAMVPDVF